MARYNGPSDEGDIARAIALDGRNNVYVTGWSRGDDVFYDYATVKYSPAYICTSGIIGDYNNDCKVNFTDLTTVAEHWLECNLDPPEACCE